MFKEIKAKFDVIGLDKYKTYHYDFVIERKESGAFNYGDHSCHILNVYDHDTQRNVHVDFFDTRYEHVSTYKPSWVKVWRNFIKREWLNIQSIELVEYEEQDVEERKR